MNAISEDREENKKILKFFEEYYSGFGCFSPQKRKDEGFPLSYGFYHKIESMHRLFYRTLIQDLQLTTLHDLKILDVGCGDGNMLRRLVEWGAQPENLFGIDASASIVEDAKRLSSPLMSFRQGLGDALPFKDHTFDILFCIGVIIHILDDETIRRMAREFLRVIKPSGSLLLVVTNETIRYDDPWMSQRARTFHRDNKDIENLFSAWTNVRRDDSIYECAESVLEVTARLSPDPKEAERIRARSSAENFLLEGTLDHDLSKLLRVFQYGSLSCYLLQPSKT